MANKYLEKLAKRGKLRKAYDLLRGERLDKAHELRGKASMKLKKAIEKDKLPKAKAQVKRIGKLSDLVGKTKYQTDKARYLTAGGLIAAVALPQVLKDVTADKKKKHKDG